MFENSSILVLSLGGHIFRIDVDRETQMGICSMFSDAIEDAYSGKTKHDYEVNYKPEEDELLQIENFRLSDEIKDAIRNPLGLDSYEDYKDEKIGEIVFTGYPEIKTIFVGERSQDEEGEHFNIAFQKYRKEQNLVTLPYRLFHSKDTFKQDSRFGIGITNNVDCYYTGEDLQFSSFFFARQVFDLSAYYRSASDPEVTSFTKSNNLAFEDVDAFKAITNTYVRRKIAMINDSGVLNDYSASEIKKIARNSGISIKVENKKVVIPSDKEGALEVLAFLDEEAYRGPFTNDLLIANSKRVLRKA